MGIKSMEILAGLLMGMAYVAAPGPIIIETLRQGMRGGLRASLAVQGGSALGPLLYGGLALLGAGALLQQSTWQPVVALGGMLILLYLGISTIRDTRALAAVAKVGASVDKSTRGALGTGAILSLANPLDIVFWLSIAAAMQQPGARGAAFFVAFAAGCIAASLLVALVAAYWQSRLSDRALRMQSLACGVCLVGFGLHLGLSATAQAAPGITVNGLTFTVNNNGDAPDINPGDLLCDTDATSPGEQCSLRAAIEEVNVQSPLNSHGILFKIRAGPAPIVIEPASPLPNIFRPVVIDGASQSGASCPTAKATGTLRIVLDGSNVPGSSADGLILSSSGGGSVRGLVIGSFASAGIVLGTNSNGYLLECNYIGLGADGVSPMGNRYGITIWGNNNTVGGPRAETAQNVISGNSRAGIFFTSGAGNNTIINNLIGTTADGMSALGNYYGVEIFESVVGNTIGGSGNLSRNVTSGNDASGISTRGSSVLIQGNFIGVAHDGVTPLGNGSDGVLILGQHSNFVGGTTPQEGNIIAYSGGDGVNIYSVGADVPLQNEVRGNGITDNGGLGIDLERGSVTENDPGDVDLGANGLQNFPVLQDLPGAVVAATLDSYPEKTYRLDFYRSDNCDSSGHGEGQEYLATAMVDTDVDGFAEHNFDLGSLPVASGDYLTATATDPDSGTSEFSACIQLDLQPPATATHTPTATATQGPSPTPTATATDGPSPTPTATATEGPSPTPTSTGTPAATAAPPGSYFQYLPIIVMESSR